MKSYLKFEHAIDLLQKPLAIVCKSNRRAGLIYSIYKVSIRFVLSFNLIHYLGFKSCKNC